MGIYSDKINAALFPLMVLAVSLILTLGVTYTFYQSSKNKDLIRFNSEVGRVQAAFEYRLNLYISLLEGGRGFVESVDNLNWQNFEQYVESLELNKNYTGIQGIGFSKLIRTGEREALIKQMKSEGYTDFTVFPDNRSEIQTAILYLEPLDDRNQKAIGYDMSTEENRRSAMERARDTGEPAATAKVLLLQEITSDKQAGFLIYLPVYKYGHLPATIAERRENLIGYIYAPLRAGDFLADIQRNTFSGQIGIAIYDDQITPENLMARTLRSEPGADGIQSDDNYRTQTDLGVAGRNWKIQYIALPAFIEQSSVGWTPLIFFGGLVFSFLLFGMTYWETLARTNLQLTAAELFELEKQKQELLEKEQAARLEAEQANSTKDEFIAVVSHELKTPLNAIGGWTRILSGENLSENTRDLALTKIEKSLRTQTKLVEALLDYSEILAGNSVLREVELDFAELVKEVLAGIEPLAAEKEVEIITENQLNGRSIVGDPDKLTIALQNLLTNSVKFSEEGGRVEVSILEDEEYVELLIKDAGQGIKPDVLPHIFERFRQEDASITRNVGGLGLGLTISNKIIKLHRGTIEADSDGPGKGAVFSVKIPWKEKE